MRTDYVVLVTVLAVALGSMPVYALTGGHRREDQLESSRRGKFILGPFVRSWFYWFVHPVVAISLRLRLSPTFFNLLGVAFGVAGGVAFANGHMALGGWGVLLGGAADALDGRIARAMGLAGPRGAFLDATLDRFAEFGAFVGLAVWYASDTLALVLVVSALGGSRAVQPRSHAAGGTAADPRLRGPAGSHLRAPDRGRRAGGVPYLGPGPGGGGHRGDRGLPDRVDHAPPGGGGRGLRLHRRKKKTPGLTGRASRSSRGRTRTDDPLINSQML